jgi:hypothetical protein
MAKARFANALLCSFLRESLGSGSSLHSSRGAQRSFSVNGFTIGKVQMFQAPQFESGVDLGCTLIKREQHTRMIQVE